MDLFIDDVYFEEKRFALGFESEKWVFGLNFIRTPHGNFGITHASKVNNSHHVGIQFRTRGLFDFEKFGTTKFQEFYTTIVEPSGISSKIGIDSIAFVRQPRNAWLWVYLLDEFGNEILSFGGHEKGLEDFANFYNKCCSEFFDFDE